MNRFVPLNRRLSGQGPAGPHEGVPQHLQTAMWSWATMNLVGQTGVRAGLLDFLEMQLEIPLGGGGGNQRFRVLENIVKADEEAFLNVVDWLLHQIRADDDGFSPMATHLEVSLSMAGSVWGVERSADTYELRRRVDPAVQDLVAIATTPGDRASQLLSDAVSHAYGRNPNPSASYRDAIRAVEAIAKPVVLPNDTTATLGKMIAAMRDAPQKWQMVLSPTSGDPILMVVEMLELLWKSQLDRHGTDDEDAPINVTVDEAQAAVHIAATLIQLFRSGAITAV